MRILRIWDHNAGSFFIETLETLERFKVLTANQKTAKKPSQHLGLLDKDLLHPQIGHEDLIWGLKNTTVI